MQDQTVWLDGDVHSWIEDWLINKKPRVVINGTASDWTPVTSGVPQGFVFGRLLSTIYINDIDVGFNNFIAKFTDDTKIGNPITLGRTRLCLQEGL